tara:strand:- start:6633 stop:6920 length:288 start_codon:yes stop_codon:yes gene_type:complete
MKILKEIVNEQDFTLLQYEPIPNHPRRLAGAMIYVLETCNGAPEVVAEYNTITVSFKSRCNHEFDCCGCTYAETWEFDLSGRHEIQIKRGIHRNL